MAHTGTITTCDTDGHTYLQQPRMNYRWVVITVYLPFPLPIQWQCNEQSNSSIQLGPGRSQYLLARCATVLGELSDGSIHSELLLQSWTSYADVTTPATTPFTTGVLKLYLSRLSFCCHFLDSRLCVIMDDFTCIDHVHVNVKNLCFVDFPLLGLMMLCCIPDNHTVVDTALIASMG